MSAMLSVRYYGDPVLRRKALPVREVDESVRRLASDMIETLRRERGVGLAANQIGMRMRLIVVDPSAGENPEEAFALVNPRITSRSGSHEDEEGCLCLPGLRLPVRRALEVRAEGLDMKGNPVTHEGRGLLARILQHETDHLNGILFIDRLPFFKRLAMKWRLFKLRRQYRRNPGKPVSS